MTPQKEAREPRKCEHLVMVMLAHPICAKGWICRDCGETVTRVEGEYVTGFVAIKAVKP